MHPCSHGDVHPPRGKTLQIKRNLSQMTIKKLLQEVRKKRNRKKRQIYVKKEAP